MADDWRGDLEEWLAPFLAALRHKTRMRLCPAYIAGLIGPGDRKSVQPMAARDGAGGYIGGGSVRGNSILAEGPASATGPISEGVFGTDFTGFQMRMGRVFLAPSANPAAGPRIARNYRTDGPHVPDVFAIRPFRKAILEKKEDIEVRGK